LAAKDKNWRRKFMMIIAKCPLRVSLVGGSTDLQAFINKYGRGSVINFPSTLYTYITIHDNHTDNYIINYSKREVVDKVAEIKNDVAREALTYFDVGPVTVTFNTDILSEGSGLAASSSYMIAIVKAVSLYESLNLSEFEICRIALELERHFNPLTGYQDSYGSGIGGFKRIDFHKDRRPLFRYFEVTFLEERYDMYLINTGIKRSSTTILQTVDIDKSAALLLLVDELEKAIEACDYKTFEAIFNEGWRQKKATSNLIADNPKIKEMDEFFEQNRMIRAVKLCGAGGGGYFLLLCDKNMMAKMNQSFDKIGKMTKIQASVVGVVGIDI
jgi:D-glycero-alpha-D-manno-heptose-7-phosphate kinase